MYCSILHQSCWRKTPEGRSIEFYQSASETQRPLLFVGGVHGDEPEGVVLANELLNWLQKNNKLRLQPWVLIPCFNQDGYAKSQRTNARGVDLNRNFPTPDWSAQFKAERYFPGKYPNSEMETQFLVKVIEQLQPRLIVHFHSWEPSVVYTGKSGQAAAKVLAEGTGYESKEDIGYPTPGSLGQYGWLVRQTPVICLEAQEKSDLSTVWPIFSRGLIRLLSEPSWTDNL